ncbi:MAG: histidine phosphatase family protein [Polyangiales bacterium]
MRALTLYLFRHGDTAWSPERRLAGRTDLPLTEHGEQSARELGARLRGARFERVFVSPLARARRTAELCGFGAASQIDDRLIELDFGRYEGLTVADVRRERTGWTYLGDGCPDGEGPTEIGLRADAFLTDLENTTGSVAVFAHSVLLRVLTARYLGLPPGAGRHLKLAPASMSILTYDEVDDARTIAAWNDRGHLTDSGPLF